MGVKKEIPVEREKNTSEKILLDWVTLTTVKKREEKEKVSG